MDIMRRIFKWFLISSGIIFVIVMIFLHVANYSTGYRAGVPIKMSHKGTIFKTWEGEMNIGGLTTSAEGVMPTSWSFSVKKGNEQVRQEIESAIDNGKRVKLHYKEKFAILFWRGDTKYFVYKVEEVK